MGLSFGYVWIKSRQGHLYFDSLKSPGLASNFVSDMIGRIYAHMINHQVTWLIIKF